MSTTPTPYAGPDMTEVLRGLGVDPVQSGESVAPESYDERRAHGPTNAEAAELDPAASIQQADPRPNTPDPAEVVEVLHTSGKSSAQQVDPGGYSWRQAVRELGSRPPWHSLSTPPAVVERWQAVEEALQDTAEAAAAFRATQPAPRRASWSATPDQQASPERAAALEGKGMPAPRKVRAGASPEALRDYASGLIQRARQARQSYDELVQQAVRGEWGEVLAGAVPGAHAAALAALADAAATLAGLGAAGDAAVQAGRVLGEEQTPESGSLANLVRTTQQQLSSTREQLLQLDTGAPLTEVPLPRMTRKEREMIARHGSDADIARLWLIERSESYKHTHLTKGFQPDAETRELARQQG